MKIQQDKLEGKLQDSIRRDYLTQGQMEIIFFSHHVVEMVVKVNAIYGWHLKRIIDGMNPKIYNLPSIQNTGNPNQVYHLAIAKFSKDFFLTTRWFTRLQIPKILEKVIRKELSDKNAHEALIASHLEEQTN